MQPRVASLSLVVALVALPALARGQAPPDPGAETTARDHVRRVLGAKHADAARSLARHDRLLKRIWHARQRDHRSSPASGYTVTRTHVLFSASEAAGTIDAVVTMKLKAARTGIRAPEFYLTRLDTLEVFDGAGAPLPVQLEDYWGMTLATVTFPAELPVGVETALRFHVAGKPDCAPDDLFGMTMCRVSDAIVFFAGADWMPMKAAWDYADMYDTGAVDLDVETPRGYVAASTSDPAGVTEVGDRLLHRFVGHHSDLLTAFAYARYDVFTATTSDGKPVRTYVHSGTRDFGQRWAEICADVTSYYDAAFAPYLFGKHDAIQAVEELGGGVGPQSATFYVASAFNTDPAEFDSEQLFAHEIAHSWWGGMVRSGDPYSPWLSEAFAEYSARLFGYTVWPKKYQDYLYSSYFQMYRDYVPLASEVALTGEGVVTTDSMTYFLTTYIKGAHVVRMLQWQLGDEAFFRGLSAYARANTWETSQTLVDVDRLRLALEEASGLDLQPFFSQWVYGTGYPVYRWAADFGNDGSRWTVRVHVEQTQAGDAVFDLPVEVALYTVGSTTPRIERLPFWGRVGDQTFELDEEPRGVAVNGSAWTWGESIPALQGDADGSNDVDGVDLIYTAWALGGFKSWEVDGGYASWADVNRDGKNDEADLAIVKAGFGTRGRIP
jgi:hypothetical protein